MRSEMAEMQPPNCLHLKMGLRTTMKNVVFFTLCVKNIMSKP